MRGRLAVVEGLVLARRPHREADRVAAVYTGEFGKVPARFPGVDRPAAKLRSLAEPMVHCELRLYVRDGAEFATAAGGRLASAFPALRGSLGVLLRGLGVVELLDRLTPWWQPGPGKLALALSALAELERAALRGRPAGWVYGAYALRMLEEAGYGLRGRKVSEENRALWESLHAASWEAVAALPEDAENQARLEALVSAAVERAAERPLRWLESRAKLRERIAV